MVWISRLALLAYLVGGWLLPAMHHHASPVAAAGKAACHQHGDSHGHGVGHSHDHPLTPQSPATQPIVDGRQADSHGHRGTCHICAASSIAKASAAVQPIGVAFDPPRGEVCASETVGLVGVWIGASSPRGPPKSV